MSAFQPTFPFSLNQLSYLSFMGHQNFNTNALSYQNDTSTANMNSNHPNGINLNALNASPCSSTMETLFLSSFSQEIHPRNPSKQYSHGKWTEIEERLYHVFVKDSAIRYPGIDMRRSERKRRFYFNEMSGFIGTRSSAQCRSHDQKMREKLWFSSKRNWCSCKKPRGQNREQEGDDMMINFEENHHIDMMVGRGMMKQIELGAVDLANKKSGYEDVDRFFSFGSEEQGKGSSGVNLDHQNFRGPVINSEFDRGYSWNDGNFNLSPSHWSDS